MTYKPVWYDATNKTKERFYKKFQEIGIGDYVRYYKEYGQIIMRFDDTEEVYLTNDDHYMLPINWKKTKLIQSI